MVSKSSGRLTALLAVAGCAMLLISIADARPPQRVGDNDLVRVLPRHGRTSLDDDFVQLWYMKTTDYGATWTRFTQAGDLGTLAPTRSLQADFQTTTTATNEVCFVLYCDSTVGGHSRGVYSFTGPDFTPVRVMEAGDNILNTVGGTNPRGWTSAGRDPDGNLYALVWGLTAAHVATFWAVKSTDNGGSWGAPFVVAQEPQIDATASYPHLSQMNSTTNVFLMYQSVGGAGFNQYVGRFPTSGGTATFVQIGSTESEFSYYVGGSLPLAYDNVNNALYAVYRSDATSGSGTTAYYSNNQGQSFTSYNIATGGTRYPSAALRTEDQIPFIASNYGVPAAAGAIHVAWFTYDQLGYGSGSWVVPPDTLATIGPYDPVTSGPVLYTNEMYWWDAQRGIGSNNVWGRNTPEGVYTERTTDGGETWIDYSPRWMARDDSINASTANMNQVAGGTNGVAYITTTFARGITDTTAPIVAFQTLMTSPTGTGPYVVRAELYDNVGIAGSTINWRWYPADTETVVYQAQDSIHYTDEATQSGTYYYHIPDTASNGHHWAAGDTIWFYCDATDNNNNYTAYFEQGILVGSEYLGAGDPPLTAPVTSFALGNNYPNPFNPTTQITFDLPATYRVSLFVFNVLGERVATLANGESLAQGRHSLTFDGSALTSGVYFYTIHAGPYSASHKMVLLK